MPLTQVNLQQPRQLGPQTLPQLLQMIMQRKMGEREMGLKERGMTLEEAIGQARIGSYERPQRTGKRVIRGKNTWWIVDPYTGELKDTKIPIAPTTLFGSLFGEEGMPELPEGAGTTEMPPTEDEGLLEKILGRFRGGKTKIKPTPRTMPTTKRPGFLGRKELEFPSGFPLKKKSKVLTEAEVRTLLKEAGGDKKKARELAKQRGWIIPK